MQNFKLTLSALSLVALFSADNAQAGFFDALIQNVATKAVESTANNVVNQAVQPATSNGPVMQNGCYYNLPPAPANYQGLNADTNHNGCVDQAELAAYLATISGQSANGAALLNALSNGSTQQALGANGQALGLAAGLANAVRAGANAPTQTPQANYNNQPVNNQSPPPAQGNPQNHPPQTNTGFMQGEVVRGKINGVKVYSSADRNAKVTAKIGKTQELVYTGTEQDGLLSVQGDGVEGWVEKAMLSK